MSRKVKRSDPAYWMLHDGVTSSSSVFSSKCYICNDPEFSQMGLPLCKPCVFCGSHVAADDSVCDKENHVQPTSYTEEVEMRKEMGLDITDELLALAKKETEDV